MVRSNVTHNLCRTPWTAPRPCTAWDVCSCDLRGTYRQASAAKGRMGGLSPA
jgi:hypothetical protein